MGGVAVRPCGARHEARTSRSGAQAEKFATWKGHHQSSCSQNGASRWTSPSRVETTRRTHALLMLSSDAPIPGRQWSIPMQSSERIGLRIKLHDVDVLMAVVRAGSMGKAATLLNTTQPAVSRSIAALEAMVGARLLERTS